MRPRRVHAGILPAIWLLNPRLRIWDLETNLTADALRLVSNCLGFDTVGNISLITKYLGGFLLFRAETSAIGTLVASELCTSH